MAVPQARIHEIIGSQTRLSRAWLPFFMHEAYEPGNKSGENHKNMPYLACFLLIDKNYFIIMLVICHKIFTAKIPHGRFPTPPPPGPERRPLPRRLPLTTQPTFHDFSQHVAVMKKAACLPCGFSLQ
jgi:hypothetical protein